MDEVKLKPCPFCGAAAEWHSVTDHEDLIRCANPDCPIRPRAEESYATERPLAAWNPRVDPQHEALVDALKASLLAIDAFWPADAPENEGQVSEDRAIARVRKQARAALREAGEDVW